MLPTEEAIEQRARELAAIAGRSANRPTASDRRQAKRELLDPIHPTSRGQDDSVNDVFPWDPAPGSRTRRAKRALPRDDQTTKELVEAGVNEAEHSQMLQARKTRTRQTG